MKLKSPHTTMHLFDATTASISKKSHQREFKKRVVCSRYKMQQRKEVGIQKLKYIKIMIGKLLQNTKMRL